MRLPWFKLLAALLIIWAIAGGLIFWARGARPTPESVMRYVDEHPVATTPPAEREKVLEKLARQLNQLAYEQRREVRMSKKLDAFFRALPPSNRPCRRH